MGDGAEERSQIEHLRAELDGYRTYLSEVSQELARARELLFHLVGDETAGCVLDGQGFCETHSQPPPCAVREARVWLGYADPG
jgi:hypothetical protein